jgi:low temperature requirement protein LtrA
MSTAEPAGRATESAASEAPARRPWMRKMVGRDPAEPHRASTPLELFFDLGFVVSVSLAAEGLHHGLSDGHYAHAIGAYAMVFFPIWWAWMNFTWFASAYDTDDGLYRLTTLVQIAGALVLAAGVPAAMDHQDYRAITYGYIVMRVAVVAQWVRASLSDPAHRPSTVRYAAGVLGVQILWIARLGLPHQGGVWAFAVLVVLELAIPVWAEQHTTTSYHPEHIAERFSLFTLIVMGEVILGATTALQAGLTEGGHAAELVKLAAAGLVIVFSMWWLYFEQPSHSRLTSLRVSLIWGYGHYLIFASIAALGAGLEVAIDHALDEAGEHHIPAHLPGLAVAVPVVIFLVALWALQVLPNDGDRSATMRVAVPIAAGLILLASVLGAIAVVATAIICAALAALSAVHGVPSGEDAR